MPRAVLVRKHIEDLCYMIHKAQENFGEDNPVVQFFRTQLLEMFESENEKSDLPRSLYIIRTGEVLRKNRHSSVEVSIPYAERGEYSFYKNYNEDSGDMGVRGF